LTSILQRVNFSVVLVLVIVWF